MGFNFVCTIFISLYATATAYTLPTHVVCRARAEKHCLQKKRCVDACKSDLIGLVARIPPTYLFHTALTNI